MTERILVSALLFGRPLELPHFPGLKTCETGPIGINTSAFRGKTARAEGPKLSNAARVIEKALDGKIKAICAGGSIYTEFNSSDGTKHKALCDGTTINFVDDLPESKTDRLIPLFLYETRPDGENTELINAVKALPDKGALYLACDSFYYGCAVRKNVTLTARELSSASVEAAVRSGTFSQSHTLCPPIVFEAAPDFSHASTVPESSSTSDYDIDEIRKGKYAIAYAWSDEQRKRIPSLSMLDGFIPTSAFRKSSRKIGYRTSKVLERLDMGLTGLEALGKDAVNFFMTGKPGTGKTTIAHALAAAYQLPFYSIPIQKGTEEGTFQGLLKTQDGKFVFKSTDFLEAFKHGGIIVLEELNLADPAILSGAIGQAIEAPYYVLEDELTQVYRHPLCIIIGTFNVGTAGSKEINPMLSSRFYQTYVVNDPSENEFIERLMTFDCDRFTAQKVYNAYTRILTYLKSDDVNALEYCKNVTFRGCVGAIQSIQEGSPFKEAIEDTLVGKIAEYDLDLAHDVLKSVIDPLPD